MDENNGINVLSLFDGMSCGMIALKRAGIKVNQYFASEIDKYAIKVSETNYPGIIHVGDVTKVSYKDGTLYTENGNFETKIDLLIGGSPCQGFSFAGLGLNFEDPRSKLFFEYIRIKEETNPKNFLLENVRMKKEHQNVISEKTGVLPIMIDSALVSAQSRKRLYWTNIGGVQQPEDKNIYLKDIIEHGSVDRNKSYCIDANYFKGGSLKNYLEKSRRQIDNLSPAQSGVFHQSEKRLMVKENNLSCIQVGEADINGLDVNRRVYSIEGKSPTLTTMGGGHREPKIALDFGGFESEYSQKRILGNIKGIDEKANCLTSSNTQNPAGCGCTNIVCASTEEIKWRKLTPLECERLQTVPEGYTDFVSNTQRYRMLGNGWTIDVIAHIFKNLNYK